MKNKSLILFLFLLYIASACHKLEKTNKADRQIELKDVLGFWKMDSLDKQLCVLWFSPDSLIYFEDRYNRGPRFYEINTFNNINILDDNKKDSICYVNSIIYLSDSILIINSVLDIKGERIYKKFDAVGKQLWEVNENKAY